MSPAHRTRQWTVLAQDPSVTKAGGKPLLTRVTTPAEDLLPGPRGHRVQVIDYDPTSNILYRPKTKELQEDKYAGRDLSVDDLLQDPHFHAQNVYAIVMATLSHFEAALGRNLDWAFESRAPQIKIAPHGAAEANAYYSRRDEALVFGYFPAPGSGGSEAGGDDIVFSCLSHDVVAHETTHALLDGIRPHYVRPSSPDQAAFHEGFADLVAILSVFRHEEVVRHVLDPSGSRRTISANRVNLETLGASPLLTLAEQMGRGAPLRESASLKPGPAVLDQPAFAAPHRRGEIIVAAILRAFVKLWNKRLAALRDVVARGGDRRYNLARVTEEGAKTAGHLLQIAIRALDYAPPVDVNFSDFLSAMLTADAEACPDDSKYEYREALLGSFGDFGITPPPRATAAGTWQEAPEGMRYDRTHFAQLQRDPIEVFEFIWRNRDDLEIVPDAFTTVESVQPLTRIGPDGFLLRETVAPYLQIIHLRAGELPRYGIDPPEGIDPKRSLRLHGGGTLIFDEFGRLKYHIGTGVRSKKQTKRLQSLWERGYLDRPDQEPRRFALAHRNRARGSLETRREAW